MVALRFLVLGRFYSALEQAGDSEFLNHFGRSLRRVAVLASQPGQRLLYEWSSYHSSTSFRTYHSLTNDRIPVDSLIEGQPCRVEAFLLLNQGENFELVTDLWFLEKAEHSLQPGWWLFKLCLDLSCLYDRTIQTPAESCISVLLDWIKIHRLLTNLTFYISKLFKSNRYLEFYS